VNTNYVAIYVKEEKGMTERYCYIYKREKRWEPQCCILLPQNVIQPHMSPMCMEKLRLIGP